MKNINALKFVGFLSLSLTLAVGCTMERSIEKLSKAEKALWIPKPKLSGKNYIMKATVTRTSSNGGFAFVGLQNESKVGYFNFTDKKLKLYNAVTPVGVHSSNVVPTLLNEWDIEHKDLKLAESDGKVSNREEEDNDKTPSQKRFFKIDFSKANLTEVSDFPRFVGNASCFTKSGTHLKDGSLKLSDDYMSFVVVADYLVSPYCADSARWIHSDMSYTIHIRYSFKKLVKTNYEPMVYQGGEFDPLHSKYGYFNSIRAYMDEKTGRIQNLILANRWDPNKTHNYFFTKDFPQEWKSMFTDKKTGIFAKTNQVFKDAGLKVRFNIHDNNGIDGKTKNFGDIRYSFINFIEEPDSGAPFGYGPSDANPLTGEIVSGNLMVWTGFVKYYMDRIEYGIKSDAERDVKSDLIQRMRDSLGSEPKDWRVALDFGKGKAGDVFHEMMMKSTYAYPFWNNFTSLDPNEKSKVFASHGRDRMSSIFKGSRHEHMLMDTLFGRTESSHENHGLEHAVTDSVIKAFGEAKNTSHKGTIFPVENLLADARQALLDGESYETILRTLLYRVSIHELGHNLNLRHNFYGSVDRKNFQAPRKVTGKDGVVQSYPAMTSSVMDYLSLGDDIHAERSWENYDKAALVYAYSGGKLDTKTKFLFCTDEHRALNSMCGVWDNGSTPSEVLMSHIESYDRLYHVINKRYGRAYWNTSGYASRIFQTMWTVKRFLVMWRTDYSESKLLERLKKNKKLTNPQRDDIAAKIEANFVETVRLSVAFYNAVLQQSAAVRDYRTLYDNRTGAITQLGLMPDKIFAMRFLVGDEQFMYNPARPRSVPSYLAYASGYSRLTKLITNIYENAVTARVAMEPWFLGYGQGLYAQTATNYVNLSDISHIEKIKIKRYSAWGLKEYFGIEVTPEMDTFITTLDYSLDPEFNIGNEEVGFTRINGLYYVISKSENPYAFSMLSDIRNSIGTDREVNSSKADLADLFYLCNRFSR